MIDGSKEGRPLENKKGGPDETLAEVSLILEKEAVTEAFTGKLLLLSFPDVGADKTEGPY